MEHGPWLMEQAERISLKFEAGIRFQKCDVTGCYWAGSGKGVGQMEMTRTCCSPVSPWKSVDLNRVKAIHYKGERRPITLKLQERKEHLRAARNYGEEAEEKDREEGEGREPREEA